LWKRGLRSRKNVPDFLGTPDIAIKKYKIVIFIDSCFWHVCPLYDEIPKRILNVGARKLKEKRIETIKSVILH
jgi:DNA mismatch endonuclease (patch repair protein)